METTLYLVVVTFLFFWNLQRRFHASVLKKRDNFFSIHWLVFSIFFPHTPVQSCYLFWGFRKKSLLLWNGNLLFWNFLCFWNSPVPKPPLGGLGNGLGSLIPQSLKGVWQGFRGSVTVAPPYKTPNHHVHPFQISWTPLNTLPPMGVLGATPPYRFFKPLFKSKIWHWFVLQRYEI